VQEAPTYLNTQQVADLLGLHYDTVKKMRHRGEGPPYVTVAKRTVRYDQAKVIAWAERRAEAA
jgi:excisionase family DNA binding protein